MTTPTPGAIASEHGSASQLGAATLARGGNAVDAAITTTLAVHLLCPYHSCVGGSGFALLRQPHDGQEAKYHYVDFRGTAPQAITLDYIKDKDTMVGGNSVIVPGEIKGLKELHDRFGKLGWKECVQPVVRLAREGMPMGKDLYDFIAKSCPNAPSVEGSWVAEDPEFLKTWTRNGHIIPVGENYQRIQYAETLDLIANDPMSVYEGEIGDAIVKAIQEGGGLMKKEDLVEYKPVWREPISSTYRGYKVTSTSAPASGAVLLSALGTMNEFPLKEAGSEHDSHITIEALRLAYGERTELGDPAFVKNTKEVEAKMLSDPKAKAAFIKDETQDPSAYTKSAQPSDSGTSNITVADDTGLTVTLTTTIGQIWASRIIIPRYNIILNDSLDDFSIPGRPNGFGYAPSAANYVQAGKRPQSSSCPYILEPASPSPSPSSSAGAASTLAPPEHPGQGKVASDLMAGGAAGGSTIISCNVQIIRNMVDYGMTPGEALSFRRLHNQLLPDVTTLERDSERGAPVQGWREGEAQKLGKRGHKTEWIEKSFSTPVCLQVSGSGYDAAGDARKWEGWSGGLVFAAPKTQTYKARRPSVV